MSLHLIIYVPTTTREVNVVCSCGVTLPALSGTDAIRVARVHVTAERIRAANVAGAATTEAE